MSSGHSASPLYRLSEDGSVTQVECEGCAERDRLREALERIDTYVAGCQSQPDWAPALAEVRSITREALRDD